MPINPYEHLSPRDILNQVQAEESKARAANQVRRAMESGRSETRVGAGILQVFTRLTFSGTNPTPSHTLEREDVRVVVEALEIVEKQHIERARELEEQVQVKPKEVTE